MSIVVSVNVGRRRTSAHTDLNVTGIDKRPVPGPVEVRAPGPKGVGGSGLIGDEVCDKRHHGGEEQAVYAYAREDLDAWAEEFGGPPRAGLFGENLTTSGVDVSGALVGEHWQIGPDLVLAVTGPRIPCRTFAGWLDRRGWVKTFTRRGCPGAYLRVVRPGAVRAGDRLRVVHRPDHEASVNLVFRAITIEPELLDRLVDVPDLPEDVREMARKRVTFTLDGA
jgi:MOSC domain-containing protein YiiM